MNGDTRSNFAALALVVGLALTVIGGILFIASFPISENEAIPEGRTQHGGSGW